jgi:acylphosphatase
MMMRITAVARGEVQGVGYRYFVTGCARAAGVTGYVRNQPDGSVVMVAEGDAVIRVDSLSVTTGDASGEFSGFGVKW